MAKFITATEVTSPRSRWTLIEVLDDPGKPDTCVLALGWWDDRAVLAMRWNGDEQKPMGKPQSSARPVWFIVPERINDPLINTLPRDKQRLARGYLPGTQDQS